MSPSVVWHNKRKETYILPCHFTPFLDLTKPQKIPGVVVWTYFQGQILELQAYFSCVGLSSEIVKQIIESFFHRYIFQSNPESHSIIIPVHRDDKPYHD